MMANQPDLSNYVATRDYDKHVTQLYRDMELEMIASLKRNLVGHKGEEIKVGMEWEAWQAAKLRELTRYRLQNRNMVKGYTNNVYQQLGPVLMHEFRQGIIGEQSRHAEAVAAGHPDALQGSFLRINDRKVTALIKELHGSIREASSAALRKMNDVYRQVIFDATLFAANGVLTEKQAFDRAMKEFTERGIDSIVYSNGAHVNIADYAGMAIRTASLRANLMGAGEFRQQLDEHLIQITKHGTACSLCVPWETKILIDDVYSGGTEADGKYPLLSYAMEKGLYHPNCRHGSGTYYPELDEVAQEVFGDNAKEKAAVAHAEHQVQKFKRLVAGSIDPHTKAKLEKRLKEWGGILKTAQNRLTSKTGSDTIQAGNMPISAEQHFANNLSKNNVNEHAYVDALKQRFGQGTSEAKAAFQQFVPLDSVADGSYAKTAHYFPTDKRIRIDYAKDAINSRGAGVTYFHEHGHLIDHATAQRLSSDPAFAQALNNDFKKLLADIKAQNAGKTKRELYQIIGNDVRDKNDTKADAYSSVSDILGGLSTTKSNGVGIRGGWMHDAGYWLRGNDRVEVEAFAHLYEAQYDPVRLAAFRQYFPTATQEFSRILKGAT